MTGFRQSLLTLVVFCCVPALATPEMPPLPPAGLALASCRTNRELPGDGVALIVYSLYGKTKMLLRYETVMGIFQRTYEGTYSDSANEDFIFKNEASTVQLNIDHDDFFGVLFVRQPRFKLIDRNLVCTSFLSDDFRHQARQDFSQGH